MRLRVLMHSFDIEKQVTSFYLSMKILIISVELIVSNVKKTQKSRYWRYYAVSRKGIIEKDERREAKKRQKKRMREESPAIRYQLPQNLGEVMKVGSGSESATPRHAGAASRTPFPSCRSTSSSSSFSFPSTTSPMSLHLLFLFRGANKRREMAKWDIRNILDSTARPRIGR